MQKLMRTLFVLFLGFALSAPMHAMHEGDERQREAYERAFGEAGGGVKPEDLMDPPRRVVLSGTVLLAATAGSIIYGIMDGMTGDGRRDDIQLYEAVKAQRSWLLHKYLAGKIREPQLLKKADNAGIKRSELYAQAIQYAEQLVDYKTALDLKERLTTQQNQDLYAEIHALETGAPIVSEQQTDAAAPTPVTEDVSEVAQDESAQDNEPAPIESDENASPDIDEFSPAVNAGYSKNTVIGACAATASVIGAATYMIAKKLANNEKRQLRNQLAHLRREQHMECIVCMDEEVNPNILLHPMNPQHKLCRACTEQILRDPRPRCPECREDLHGHRHFINHQLLNLPR